LREATVLVVDDDTGFRRFIVEAVKGAGFSVVEAADADTALAATRRRPPQAAILDVSLPGVSGFGLCRELRERHGDHMPVIFVSGERRDPLDRAAGILVGGDDYLVKPVHPDELVARLRRILMRANGHNGSSTTAELTDREVEILQLVAEGGSAAEVASQLYISRKTVSSHMQRIFTKLGVHSRAQAVAVAYAAGLISVSPHHEVQAHGVPADAA
jgi:DNA-binding NarL/FixJ family response regulator